MSPIDERPPKDNENRLKTGGLALGLAGGLLAAMQADIANFKAAEQNNQHMLVITEPAQLAEQYPLAFTTDVLRATSKLIDPVSGATIAHAVAVHVTEERYKRRRRSSGWRTVNNYTQQASATLGALEVEASLLANNVRDVRRKLDLTQLDPIALQRFYGPISANTHIAYADSRHRYVYNYVPDNITVTAIAKVNDQGGRYSLAPSPLMPSGYPALEPGEISPKDYMSKLRGRFFNTLLASGGALFLIGWFFIAILSSTAAREQKIPAPLSALAAAGSAIATLGIWFVTVSWPIGLVSWLIISLIFYWLLQATNTRKEFFNG